MNRSGFIARPFRTDEADFLELEECTRDFLSSHQIQAKRYIHPPGKDYILSELMNQIRDAHFGIVDITTCNSNVMLELGMMMILGKKFILFRQREDTHSLPFDIRNYQCYQYEVWRNGICTWNPGDDNPISIKEVLRRFLRKKLPVIQAPKPPRLGALNLVPPNLGYGVHTSTGN
ncbi:MAG: hypothetical protein AAF282_21705 [Cyanobacteria bacterium P01_A01_bin.15]